MTSFWAQLTNPWALIQYAHNICGALATGSFVVAAAHAGSRFASIQDYTDVVAHVLKEVEHFFSIYKGLEGKSAKVLDWKGRKNAYKTIRSSHERLGLLKARGVGNAIWE